MDETTNALRVAEEEEKDEEEEKQEELGTAFDGDGKRRSRRGQHRAVKSQGRTTQTAAAAARSTTTASPSPKKTAVTKTTTTTTKKAKKPKVGARRGGRKMLVARKSTGSKAPRQWQYPRAIRRVSAATAIPAVIDDIDKKFAKDIYNDILRIGDRIIQRATTATERSCSSSSRSQDGGDHGGDEDKEEEEDAVVVIPTKTNHCDELRLLWICYDRLMMILKPYYSPGSPTTNYGWLYNQQLIVELVMITSLCLKIEQIQLELDDDADADEEEEENTQKKNNDKTTKRPTTSRRGLTKKKQKQDNNVETNDKILSLSTTIERIGKQLSIFHINKIDTPKSLRLSSFTKDDWIWFEYYIQLIHENLLRKDANIRVHGLEEDDNDDDGQEEDDSIHEGRSKHESFTTAYQTVIDAIQDIIQKQQNNGQLKPTVRLEMYETLIKSCHDAIYSWYQIVSPTPETEVIGARITAATNDCSSDSDDDEEMENHQKEKVTRPSPLEQERVCAFVEHVPVGENGVVSPVPFVTTTGSTITAEGWGETAMPLPGKDDNSRNDETVERQNEPRQQTRNNKSKSGGKAKNNDEEYLPSDDDGENEDDDDAELEEALQTQTDATPRRSNGPRQSASKKTNLEPKRRLTWDDSSSSSSEASWDSHEVSYPGQIGGNPRRYTFHGIFSQRTTTNDQNTNKKRRLSEEIEIRRDDKSDSSTEENYRPGRYSLPTNFDRHETSYRSLKTKRKSQQKKYEGRRQWLPEEAKAIKEGVRLYGIGHWAKIKNRYDYVLRNRTSGQIKVRAHSPSGVWMRFLRFDMIDSSSHWILVGLHKFVSQQLLEFPQDKFRTMKKRGEL